MRKKTSRREFVRLAASSAIATGLAPGLIHSSFAASSTKRTRIGPNDKVRLGLIGMGIIGLYDVETALRVPGVELIAVAEVYDSRRTRAQELFGKEVATTRDYREIIARPDIDAVLIAVPDHWHARMTIDALEAGKHVYCEKPMVQDIEEGPRVIEAHQKSGRVMQVGSQFVASPAFHKVKELLAADLIGELNLVEAINSRNSDVGAWQYSIAPTASPENLDWERFLGNAPKRPFDPVRYFRWRNYWDYGTGIAGDLFVHLFTGVHYALEAIGPNLVMATGGLRFWNDGREVPDVMQALFQYPEKSNHPAFTLTMRVNLADGSTGEAPGMRFIGSDGVINVYDDRVTVVQRPIQRAPEMLLVRGYNSVRSWDEATQKEFVEWYRKQPNQPPAGRPQEPKTEEFKMPQVDDRLEHVTTFFNAIRGQGKIVEDAVFGYRAAAPSILSNTSYIEKRAIEWNPEDMQVIS